MFLRPFPFSSRRTSSQIGQKGLEAKVTVPRVGNQRSVKTTAKVLGITKQEARRSWERVAYLEFVPETV